MQQLHQIKLINYWLSYVIKYKMKNSNIEVENIKIKKMFNNEVYSHNI